MTAVSNPQSEFTMNLLTLIVRIALQGGYETIDKLGLRSDQIGVLSALNTQEIQQIALIAKTNFVSIKFDTAALDAAINLSHQRSQERNLIVRLITGGASRRLMHQLFGLTPRDISELRNFLALPDNTNGRPPIPNEQQQVTLWNHWNALKLKNNATEAYGLGEILAELHELTQIRINAIWLLLESWLEEEKNASSQLKTYLNR